jgi:MFS family permease
MQFQPSDTLKSRSYLGLILSQFQAAFNDQAIHASAMFYALHQGTLTQDQAIAFMPILFFAPWAIFCTLAGYLADRYSKRNSIVFWKIAEIGITLVALLGFTLGTVGKNPIGPWIVLSTVFLMGTHSAFFVPAKYGIMPEILQAQLLSKANGILESTSFLAVILGTVSGGIFSFRFHGSEYWIGLILLALSLCGAATSFLVQLVPPANPTRRFPRNLVKPLVDNLRTMLRSKPLALAVLGIAFFTFMVAFMRSTMYMHGESSVPRWNEFKTSLVVATVALGVGMGSYLAGVFSGGKVELGLVPLGAVGMACATLLAALWLFWLPGLIAALIVIGFFSGFYIVPLYTLLQHRAPKASKGDLIATSNFINVTGAIVASLLFFALVFFAKTTGIAPLVDQQDGYAKGELIKLEFRHGRPHAFEIRTNPDTGEELKVVARSHPPTEPTEEVKEPAEEEDTELRTIEVDDNLIEIGGGSLQPGSKVVVSTYSLRNVTHYKLRAADQPLKPAYDLELVPHYLFVGAGLMTLAILLLLCRQLPDFFVRALLWLRSHGRYRLKVVGVQNLPSNGPVILATNCDRFETCMQVVTATDRFTRFVLLEGDPDERPPFLLRYLARRTGLIPLEPKQFKTPIWEKAILSATRSLRDGQIIALTAEGNVPTRDTSRFLQQLRAANQAVLLPVYCGALPSPSRHDGKPSMVRRMQVVIGHPLPPDADHAEVCRAIHHLGDWMRKMDQAGETLVSIAIPGGIDAAPTESASSSPTHK